MPPKGQTNPQNDPEFDSKVKDLYAKYLRKCADDRTEPVPFKAFRKWVLDQAARLISTNMAAERFNEPRDGKDAIYVAMRVEDVKESVDGSVTGECGQCHQPVLLDPAMTQYLENAKAVICNRCLPEVTGQTFGEAAQQEIDHYNEKHGEDKT